MRPSHTEREYRQHVTAEQRRQPANSAGRMQRGAQHGLLVLSQHRDLSERHAVTLWQISSNVHVLTGADPFPTIGTLSILR